MDFQELQNKAIQVRGKYAEYEKQVIGKSWNFVEQTQGLVVDVGELTELVMAKNGVRKFNGENLDKALAHELADILESILIISNELGIGLEKSFLETREEVLEKLDNKIKEGK